MLTAEIREDDEPDVERGRHQAEQHRRTLGTAATFLGFIDGKIHARHSSVLGAASDDVC